MLHRPSIAAVAGFALAAATFAQAPTSPAPQQNQPEQKQPAASKSAADYIGDLGSDNFRVRSQAERALRGMGKDAVAALEKAAGDESDAEVQWRARRLLRQIERGDGEGGLARRDRADDAAPKAQAPGNGGTRRRALDDMQGRFDELFRDLEQQFGVDVPRARFFRDDFFQDLRQQMQDAQQRMQQGVGQGQSMSMQMTPDGVRVEIKSRNDKGEEETKVYEAPDLETFKQKYPDVLQHHGLGQGFNFGFGQGMPGGGLQWLRFGDDDAMKQPLGGFRVVQPGGGWMLPGQSEPDQGAPAIADAVPPPADRRLGVAVKPEIPAEVRAYLGIEHGLMVEQVQDGTLATTLGLEKGDIVLEVGGKEIHGTADVQEALGGIAAGQQVQVKVLRRGKELQLHADKPEVKATTPAPLEKRGTTGDGKIR